MPWDSDKQNFTERSEVGESEKLSAAEWNAHVADQKDHSARHAAGGIDEVSVEGLSGDLADAQDPKQGVVNDFVDALLAGGSNVTTTYDDAAGTLTIDTSALNDDEVRDTINDTLVGGGQVTTTYDDTAGTLTIDIDAPAQAEFDNHSARHESGGSDALSLLAQQISDFGTSVIDSVAGSEIAPSAITDLWNGTAVTADVDNESVSTEELTNAILNDGVNYIHPKWIVETNLDWFYHDQWPSFDGFDQSTSGSGSIGTFSSGRAIDVESGSTDGSSASLQMGHGGPTTGQGFDWDSDTVWRVEHRSISIDDGQFFAWGDPSTEAQLSARAHIGVGINSAGDLIGTVCDGSARSTVTLITNVGIGGRDIIMRYEAGNSVEYEVDGTVEGSITTNLPTGTTNAPWIHSLIAFNADTEAGNSRILVGGIGAVQGGGVT